MLKAGMYILGFILIFAGLALMLYYFVLRFAGAQSVQKVSEPVEPTASVVTVTASPELPVHRAEPLERAVPEPLRTRLPEKQPEPSLRVVDQVEEKELFATGYLYTDASGKTALLEHPERVEGEMTAAMKRLGPATLRFRRGSYYFDHGDGLLVIPERQMREVRFSDGGTVFVPGSAELPLVYFFTVETQAIREFLSSRS